MSEQQREQAEAARQAAEVERERREDLRRIGEGGPEQHVPGNVQTGRVEAEAQRVMAEQERVGMSALFIRLTGIFALPIAFIALIPSLVGIWLLDNETDERITENRVLAAQGVEAKRALCVFRADLERRANDTAEYLAELRSGKREPIPGLTNADFARSLAAQRSTLKALADLEC